jgi:hypothetical protein
MFVMGSSDKHLFAAEAGRGHTERYVVYGKDIGMFMRGCVGGWAINNDVDNLHRWGAQSAHR